MSKSMSLMVDTSKATILTRTPPPSVQTTTIPTTTTARSTPAITPIELSNAIDGKSTDEEEDNSMAANIKVILYRQQQQQRLRQLSTIATTTSLPPSKLRSAIRSAQIEVFLAVFVSFMLFLVIYSIFSLKRNDESEKLGTICDKAKLLPVNTTTTTTLSINCNETDFCQPTQTIHV